VSAQPCKNPVVVAQLEAAKEDVADYRAAAAEIDGKPYAACWKPLFQRKEIYLRYEDGDGGLIPFDDLKPLKDA